MLMFSLSTLCEERKDAWAPFSMSAPELSPIADKLDDGVACRGFVLDFAGDFARAFVFVYADRRDKFLLPYHRLDAQACLQHRDGHHPMRWIATAGRGACPDANAIPVVQTDPHPGPLHMRPER